MSVSVESHIVPQDRIDAVWPHVRAWLRDAIEHCGDWTIESLHGVVSRGEALLWVVSDGQRMRAAAVTEAVMVPRGKICRVLACGGERVTTWQAAMAPVETYARALGCVAMRIEGRAGWRRAFDDYDLEWVTLEKGLR